MKKVLWLLALVFAFTLAVMAQESGAGATDQSQTTTTTKKSSHKKGSGDMSNMDMGASGKKGSTLTGCLSKDPNAEGMYTLTNGRMKKGVEVGPTDKVKDHAGHQVKLSGSWASAAAAGETGAEATSSKEKGHRHFEVESVTHISDTCSEAPGGGTTGMAKSGKKKGSSSTPQNPQ